MTEHRHRGPTRRALMAAALPAGLITLAEARAQDSESQRGGTLTTLLTPEPPGLVPGVNNLAPTLLVAGKIFQGLLKFSPELEPLAELAASWQLSDDRLTYTFHLQSGVTWHDGTPFTADDVIFSVMQFHRTLSPRAGVLFAAIREATAPDPLTVRFTLDAPFNPFLLMFDATAAAMVPKHLYDGTDYRANPANQRPVGTGPFQFVAWQRGNFIRLRRYDAYWKPGQPGLDEIIYRIVPDSQRRALALESGQVQLAAAHDIEPFDVPRLRTMPDLMVNNGGWEYLAPLSWIELNHRVKPLDDVRVRLAISHAIDRSVIVNRLWFGAGKAATSPIASGTRFFDPSVKLPAYDPRLAATLLNGAGLLAGADGVRFSLRHLVAPYGEVWTRLSAYLRASLARVGIDLRLETTDAAAWAARIAAWDYDTSVSFAYQYGDPTLGVERSYVSDNIRNVAFANTGGYVNRRVDALFARARLATDPNQRQAAFSAVQKVLAADVPQIWLMEMAFPAIHARRLHDAVRLGTGVHACFDDVSLG